MIDLVFKSASLLILFVILNYYSSYFWKKALGSKIYILLMFPGVVIHELFHLLGCFLTGAKVKKVKLFSKRGGFVKHKKAKLPIIGQVIISLAPLFGGIIFLKIIFYYFNFDPTIFSISSIITAGFKFSIQNYRNWKFWLLLYLTISVIINVIPSKKDFKNSISGLLFLFFLFLILINFNFFTPFISTFLASFVNFILTGLTFSILSLLIALIVNPLSFFVKKIIN
jgi:hypothetical protein